MQMTRCEDCDEFIPGSLVMVETHKKNECMGRWKDDNITTPKDKDDEREIIWDIMKDDKMVRGNTYFILSFKWWQLWCDYVGYPLSLQEDAGAQSPRPKAASGFTPPKPGPIDNESLLKGGEETEGERNYFLEMKEDLVRGYDYEIVPWRVWMRFKKWYSGGPGIPKKVIRESGRNPTSRVDIYPINLYVQVLPGTSAPLMYSLYRLQTIIDLKYLITNDLYVRPHQCALYLLQEDGSEIRMEKEHYKMTLDELKIKSRSTIILNKEIEDTGIINTQLAGMRHNYSPYYWVPQNERGQVIQTGICGFHNIGNTCFMNSALQCLIQTVPLAGYFLSKKHLALNANSNLCKEFYKILKKVWGGKFTSVVPNGFRSAVVKIAPQFAGYAQHDSQELLYFVLEGLHEELIHKEPAQADPNKPKPEGTENVSSKPPEKPSIITDLFQGKYSSSVTCLKCNHTSVTTEPFLFLSLPVPAKNLRKVEVYFFPLHGPPTKYAVRVLKSGNIGNLRKEFSEMIKKKVEQLSVFEFYSGQMFEVTDGKKLSDIRGHDMIFINEVEDNAFCHVRVYHRRLTPSGEWHLFAYPFLVSFKEGESNRSILNLIRSKLEYYIQSKNLTYSVLLSRYNGVDHGLPIESNSNTFSNEEGTVFVINWEPEAVETVSKAIGLIVQHESLTPQPDDEELIVELDECLRLFTVEEELSGTNSWFCTTCKQKVPSKKKITLSSLPEVLVLHLKRFQYTTLFRDKITSQVNFPLVDLDLSAYVHNPAPKPVYDLFGVSNHLGGLSGGHYTAFTKSKNDNEWYKLDDNRSQVVQDVSNVLTPNAYLLFYRLRESKVEVDWPAEVVSSEEEGKKEGEKEKTEVPPPKPEKKKADKEDWQGEGRTGRDEGRLMHPMANPDRGAHRHPDAMWDDEPLPPSHHANPPSGYLCPICSERLQGFEELQVHLLTIHFDDPVAKSLMGFS